MDKESEIKRGEPKPADDIDAKIKERIDGVFSDGQLLDWDVINAWISVFDAYEDKKMDELKPLPHYRQHYEEKGTRDVEGFRQSWGEEGAQEVQEYYPRELQRRMEFSDPAQVILYDQLVDEFNADLGRIKKEEDFEKLKYFGDQALKIIKAKKKKSNN